MSNYDDIKNAIDKSAERLVKIATGARAIASSVKTKIREFFNGGYFSNGSYDDIKKAIDKDAQLSGLLKETIEAVQAYVVVGIPVWDAKHAQIIADAAATGEKTGVPMNIERFLADKPSSLEAFIIAGLDHCGTDHKALAEAIGKMRDEYRNKSKLLVPAP